MRPGYWGCLGSLVQGCITGAWGSAWHLVGSQSLSNERTHEWMGWIWRPTCLPVFTVALLTRKLKHTRTIPLEPHSRSALTPAGKLSWLDTWGSQSMGRPPPGLLCCVELRCHWESHFDEGKRKHCFTGQCLGTWRCSLCFHSAEFWLHSF